MTDLLRCIGNAVSKSLQSIADVCVPAVRDVDVRPVAMVPVMTVMTMVPVVTVMTVMITTKASQKIRP